MNAFYIPPSSYAWLIPKFVDISVIDEMALNGTFPTLYSLYPSIIFACLFGILRSILQDSLFRPVATHMMKLKFSKQEAVRAIDQHLKTTKAVAGKVSDDTQKALAEQTGLSKVQVKRYVWNKYRDEVNKKKVTKFGEAMWRSMFYSFFCVLGYVTLCMPEYAVWLLNNEQNFINWPYHPISQLMNFYYQVELGCYIHQLHWTEVNRSDAAEMILHHIITIVLILSSYLNNFTRVGTSILLCHDFADIFLEVGKCFNYTSKTPEYKYWASKITDTLFACFTVSFFVTRLVIYPRYLLYSVVVQSREILGMWPGYWLLTVMLCSLQCLHVFWFYLIVRMIYRLLHVGEIEKDVRSDDEDEGMLQDEKEPDDDKKEK